MPKQSPERATKRHINFSRPRDPKAALAYAVERHKSISEDEPNGKPGQPNVGVLSQQQIEAHNAAYNAAVEKFNAAETPAEQAKVKFPAPLPPLYCIALVDAAISDHAICVVGKPSEPKLLTDEQKNALSADRLAKYEASLVQPEDWKANAVGGWQYGLRLADPLQQDIRGHHAHDVRKLVLDRENSIVDLGKLGEFVIGGANSAINAIAGSITGCNLAIHLAVHKLAFAGNKAVANLVGRINSKPVNVTQEDGSIQTFHAGGLVEWGYLVKGKNSNRLTYEQIKALDSFVGVKFVMADRIVGTPVPKSKIFAEVKRTMSLAATVDLDGKSDWDRFIARPKKGSGAKRSPEECVMQNIATQCRIHPKSLSPFGIGGTQIGMPLFTCFTGDSVKSMTECVNTVINGRLPVGEMETERDAKYRLTPEDVEESPKKSKAKSESKTKSKGKSGKSKGKSKKNATKAKSTESTVEEVAAPSVETEVVESVGVAETEVASLVS